MHHLKLLQRPITSITFNRLANRLPEFYKERPKAYHYEVVVGYNEEFWCQDVGFGLPTTQTVRFNNLTDATTFVNRVIRKLDE